MASEISVTQQLTATKGNVTVSKSRSFTADWASARRSGAVQNIPTTAAGTALVLNAGVTTPRWAYFLNTDATNYVELGIQTGGTFFPFAYLKPGASTVVPLSPAASAIYARANTNAVDLEFEILQD